MASRDEDSFDAPDDSKAESLPPAGLTFGRRVGNAPEGQGAPPRGQVKGVFGITAASQARVRSAATPAPAEEAAASHARAEESKPGGFNPFDEDEGAAEAGRQAIELQEERSRADAVAAHQAEVAAFERGRKRGLREQPRSAGLTAFGRPAEPPLASAGEGAHDPALESDSERGGQRVPGSAAMRATEGSGGRGPAQAQRVAGLTAFGRPSAERAAGTAFTPDAELPGGEAAAPFDDQLAPPSAAARARASGGSTRTAASTTAGLRAAPSGVSEGVASARGEPQRAAEFGAFEAESDGRDGPAQVGDFAASDEGESEALAEAHEAAEPAARGSFARGAGLGALRARSGAPAAAVKAGGAAASEGEFTARGEGATAGGFAAFEGESAAPDEGAKAGAFAAFEAGSEARDEGATAGGFAAFEGEQTPAPDAEATQFTPFEGELEEESAAEESFFGDGQAAAPAERRRGLTSVPPPVPDGSVAGPLPGGQAAAGDANPAAGASKSTRSGTRHKKVEATEVQQRLKSVPPPVARRVSARPQRPASANSSEGAEQAARASASLPPAAMLPVDPQPAVHAPRWWLTGAILIAALVAGGAFMVWSLRSTSGSVPRSSPTGSRAAKPGGESEIVTWSPHSKQQVQPGMAIAPGEQPGTASAVPAADRGADAPGGEKGPTAAAAQAEPATGAPAATVTPEPGKPAPNAAGPGTADAPGAQPAPGSGTAPTAAAADSAQAAVAPARAAAATDKPEGSATPAGQAPAPAADPGSNDDADSAKAIAGWLSTARKRLARDDPHAAELLARKVLNADAQNSAALGILAHALMDQDRGREALPLARKLVQLSPRKAASRLLLGDVLLMVGDAAAAKTEWQRALEITPDDAETRRRLGL